MATLREIKKRIEGIRKIQKVAKAMEVVANTKLRKIERLVLTSRPYAEKMREIFISVATRCRYKHPLLTKTFEEIATDSKRSEGRDSGGNKICAVVFTSDRGLCGIFNTNIINTVNELSRTVAGLLLIVIGRKGCSYFRRKGFVREGEYRDLTMKSLPQVSQDIASQVINLYTQKKVDRVYLIYNKFRLNLIGQVSRLQLLPVEVEKKEGIITDYLYEPTPEGVLDKFIPDYIVEQIRQVILESRASEEIARMVAMKMARDNADELIDTLSLDYHKARQASITRQIIEVVSGASA